MEPCLDPRVFSGLFIRTEIRTTYLQTKGLILLFIIHQTHYEKSDWSRAFNQFTIACELDMINAISAADIAVIMSSSQPYYRSRYK